MVSYLKINNIYEGSISKVCELKILSGWFSLDSMSDFSKDNLLNKCAIFLVFRFDIHRNAVWLKTNEIWGLTNVPAKIPEHQRYVCFKIKIFLEKIGLSFMKHKTIPSEPKCPKNQLQHN